MAHNKPRESETSAVDQEPPRVVLARPPGTAVAFSSTAGVFPSDDSMGADLAIGLRAKKAYCLRTACAAPSVLAHHAMVTGGGDLRHS